MSQGGLHFQADSVTAECGGGAQCEAERGVGGHRVGVWPSGDSDFSAQLVYL